VDQTTQIIQSINSLLWGMYGLIPLLVGTGLYFTFKLRFVQIKRFVMAVKHVFGGITLFGRKADKDGMSSFQSLATAISAQVGTGNLAGVATAIAMGGPGAIFWMWIAAFFGMATIFAEAVLAQVYRTRDDAGHITGGPAYYISKGLGSHKLAVFFSVSIIIALGCIGNMVQSNSIADAFKTAFDVPPLVMGLIIAACGAFVFFGGIGRIAAVTEKMVPLMALLYVIGGLFVVLSNADQIIPAFKMIFVGAFDPSAATGGIIGAGVKEAIRYGVARGLFSNEAGVGSAPNAAASAAVSHPVKQGLVQMLSVFIDTILICSATAFMLLCSGVEPTSKLAGMPWVQAAASSSLGGFGTIFITIALCLFAFTTLIGNFYYAEMGLKFLCGRKPPKAVINTFRIIAAAIVLAGATMEFSIVWNTADVLMGLMALINLPVILILCKPAIQAMNDYTKQKKAGKDPVFKAADIQLKDKTDFWN